MATIGPCKDCSYWLENKPGSEIGMCQRYPPAPCGHSIQYSYTEDNGKHIRCLLCVKRERDEMRECAEQLIEEYDKDGYYLKGFIEALRAAVESAKQ